MDGAQVEDASDWVDLSASTGSAQRLRRVVGFGERVRGGNPSTNENHDDESTMCKWESLRTGGLVPAAGCGFRRACPWGKTVHE